MMKSFIYTVTLISALGVNNLHAQGRSGDAGRAGGVREIPTPSERALDRPTPSNSDRGNRQNSAADRNANAASEGKKALGTQDPSLQLAENSGLSTQIAKLFPKDTDLGAMASGFRTLGEFVAAAHLSKNMEIPFDQLRLKMVTEGSSLSEALHELKPELSQSAVKDEAKKAEDQARKDTARE
jgi:hypothetical protein